MNRRRHVWSLSVAFALLCLGGCATPTDQSEIGVNVVEIVPTQTSLLETTARLTLRLTNERSAPLVLNGSANRLYFNGSYVGRGVSNTSLTVPPLGTATLEVSVFLENLVLVRKAAEFSQALASLDYRLVTQLHTAGREGTGRIKVVSTGQLDVRGLLAGVRSPGTAETGNRVSR